MFFILTTGPNRLVAPIHHKAMPVRLHDQDETRWLSAPLEEALTLAAPFPAQLVAVA
ncbi:SOS response-associated peptidase [Sphingomonas morindae]|uniref:SOS response-associated peptidase n=1 Tax=Sphingomonas morindae TaxID=1541170 RepID=A0ABY4X412_9SPHN|nr:SOS response-associated peptidase [Sphingomonas morindae]USI71595.1 SOS response-associated peptidase [Sphingomonas morindae]